ncbi:hypothetical protein [Allokutzneria albata]|uniref:Peptidase M15 n=1 Tax=Allokutzneria albata TaxID=211114 RepID=A0A1G9YGS5_ALLAB|nr:hypothetical protein [Allokutzneria albata]SDN07756.1 hypothetical protein SAMN04489726_4788 [Allokutzneria albata]
MNRSSVITALGVAAVAAALLPGPSALASALPGTEASVPEAQRLAGFTPPATDRSGVKLSHATAVARLTAAGIGIWSSGNCSDRLNPNCTSFEQINSGTIDGIVTLRNASGCALVATGGTEDAHGSHAGYSHWNGYKIDFRRNDCVEGYIRRTFAKVVPPTFGIEQYKAPSGNVYTNESDHWDVLYW